MGSSGCRRSRGCGASSSVGSDSLQNWVAAPDSSDAYAKICSKLAQALTHSFMVV